MSWNEDAAQMAADIQDAFGREVLYHDDSLRDPVTLYCPVGHERIDRRKNDYGGTDSVAVIDVYVLDTDQAIRHDGVSTIDSKRYAIDSMHPRIGGRTQCVVRHTTSIEKSRKRYRG